MSIKKKHENGKIQPFEDVSLIKKWWFSIGHIGFRGEKPGTPFLQNVQQMFVRLVVIIRLAAAGLAEKQRLMFWRGEKRRFAKTETFEEKEERKKNNMYIYIYIYTYIYSLGFILQKCGKAKQRENIYLDLPHKFYTLGRSRYIYFYIYPFFEVHPSDFFCF